MFASLTPISPAREGATGRAPPQRLHREVASLGRCRHAAVGRACALPGGRALDSRGGISAIRSAEGEEFEPSSDEPAKPSLLSSGGATVSTPSTTPRFVASAPSPSSCWVRRLFPLT